ncbi:MAG: MoaD/ThiS family protein [Steroidobacteraceae bacterium]
MVRVQLPHHLRNLAAVGREVSLQVEAPASVGSILDALESAYPVLKGTIREHGTLKRRLFLRFFAGGEDVSLQPPDLCLPASVASGDEPFMIVGAIAGG